MRLETFILFAIFLLLALLVGRLCSQNTVRVRHAPAAPAFRLTPIQNSGIDSLHGFSAYGRRPC